MSRYHKVQDKEGLVRDTLSGAIVNVDDNAWSAHKAAKQARDKIKFERDQQKCQINNLESEVGSLKGELTTIKSLLSQILEKMNG